MDRKSRDARARAGGVSPKLAGAERAETWGDRREGEAFTLVGSHWSMARGHKKAGIPDHTRKWVDGELSMYTVGRCRVVLIG